MYPCPNCNRPIQPDLVEEFDGGSGCDQTQYHDFDCPACGRRVAVTCAVEVEYTLGGDGEEAEERDPTLMRVVSGDNRLNDPKSFVAVPPAQIFVTEDPVCMVCGDRKRGCRCAADLISGGWRVVLEYTGLRTTCPQCYGG